MSVLSAAMTSHSHAAYSVQKCTTIIMGRLYPVAQWLVLLPDTKSGVQSLICANFFSDLIRALGLTQPQMGIRKISEK
jgi:hypothetical protein